MSVRMMTLVWELTLPDSEKLVLLALADCANDEGRCWPSMATLSKKCSKSDRTIQACIKMLCVKGHLTREEVMGRGCNYIVHPIVRFDTPETTSPRSDCAPEVISPREDFGGPPKSVRETPEAASDKPSKNHKEPSNDDDPSVEDLQEAWNAVAAPRGAIACKRITPERRRKLAPVLKRHAVEDLTEAIEAVGRSKFLCGDNPRKYRASITFLCSPEHIEKLLEGSYA